MFRGLELPKDLVRERKLPDGGTVREMGPFVYGYSFSMGPDGKPIVREFGKGTPSLKGRPFGTANASRDVRDGREPLAHAVRQSDAVQVAAEVPGVDTPDIAPECQAR